LQHGVSFVFEKDRGGVTGRICDEGRLVSKGGQRWGWWRRRRRGIHYRLGRASPRGGVLRQSFWLLARVQVRERLAEVVSVGDWLQRS